MVEHNLTLEEQRHLLAQFMGFFKKDGESDWYRYEGDKLCEYCGMGYTPDKNWDQLMSIIEKIRGWKTYEKGAKINEIFLDELSIGRCIISIKLFKWTKEGWEFPHIFHIHNPNNLELSDCKSFQELLFKSAVDFVFLIQINK